MSQNPGELRMVPTTAIHPDPNNPRTEMGDIDQLAHELKQLGQMDAITVYPHPTLAGDYKIQGGHRRHAAALRAGLESMKCVIVDAPENATLDLYTEAMSTGTNHLPLDTLGQSKALQGMLTEGKSEAWISKNFHIEKAEVKPRASLASNARVAKLHETGVIDLLGAAPLLELEKETGDGSLFESTLEALEGSRYSKDQTEIDRLIEQKKANALRNKVRSDLTAAGAVEIDSQNRYSGKWTKSELVLSVEEHVAAGHQFDVSAADEVHWWAKTRTSKAQMSEEEKEHRERVRYLDTHLNIAAEARRKFVMRKIQDKKGLEERNARGLLIDLIFQQGVNRPADDGAMAVGDAVHIPYPKFDPAESNWSEHREARGQWAAKVRVALQRMTLPQLSLLLAYAPIADVDKKLAKHNFYLRDSPDKEARWAPISRWYQQLIDYAGYVPSDDEAEAIRLGEKDKKYAENDVHLNTATCKNCRQEVVKDTRWTGICDECAPAIDGIEVV
ncbi:ParB/RepB/Spo0J family partition protein [Glutamicibacter sp. NPDC087344]|uniref:ParB/RepB/Spo0J family partition protein n=1 Tax=Glutamicibacter sp. NPDC087344 TaxID=3363994 RepID=UPI0038159258